MPREIPIPTKAMLGKGVNVALHHTTQGWCLTITPIGATASEKLRPRWTAHYRVSRSAVPKDPTVRDGCLALAEDLCLALDGWLETSLVESP